MTFLSPVHDGFPVASMHHISGIAMKCSSETKRQRYSVTSTDVGERTSAFLRRRHPERTVDNVAADLAAWDIKPERIAAMLQRQTGPGSVLWLALIWAYGPEFLAEVHPAPLGWLSAAAREQKQRELDDRIAALVAERERLS